MSRASDVLKKFKSFNEEERVGGDDKNDDEVGKKNRASLEKIVERLVKEEFSKDNDSQMKAADDMKKLGEADDDEANAFMKKMDEAASGFSFKKKK